MSTDDKKPSITIGKSKFDSNTDFYISILGDFQLEKNSLVKLVKIIPPMIDSYFQAEKSIPNDLTDDEIKELKKYVDFFSANINENSKTFEFSSQKVFERIFQSQSNFLFEGRFKRFIRINALIFLVSEFEYFLKRTLDLTFSIKPEILKTRKKTIEYEEFFDSNPDKVFHTILDKELKQFLSYDIQDMSKYLKNTFNLHLSDRTDWDEFKERFYRRHILMHNRGKIDEQYNKKTNQNHGHHYLTVNDKYFERTVELFTIYAEFISEFLSKKFSSLPSPKLTRHEITCARLPEEHEEFTCDPYSE